MWHYLLSILLTVLLIFKLNSLSKKIKQIKANIDLRVHIREILKKHTVTIGYLKKGFFKKHEIMKSLTDKVMDDLSDKKLSIQDRRSMGKIIQDEIENVLRGYEGIGRVQHVMLRTHKRQFYLLLCFGLIAIFALPVISTNVGEKIAVAEKNKEAKIHSLINNAQIHKDKSEWTLAKQELDKALDLDDSSKEAMVLLKEVETKLDEVYLQNGINHLNNGDDTAAIKELKKVRKASPKYEEAKNYLNVASDNKTMKQSKDISYIELKKDAKQYKGENLHFYGRIYNIQEINGKTMISLSTGAEYTSDEAILLFPSKTPLVEGSFIEIYGEMTGNYQNQQSYINQFLDGAKYSIYYNQGTFIEQAPVIKTTIIKDSSGTIYK